MMACEKIEQRLKLKEEADMHETFVKLLLSFISETYDLLYYIENHAFFFRK